MLLTEREKEICKKYSACDENGRVHCAECPMRINKIESIGNYDFRCHANSHYNKHTKEWDYDE